MPAASSVPTVRDQDAESAARNKRPRPPFLRKASDSGEILYLYSPELHAIGESYKAIVCGISKAKEELGYEPKVYLQPGMQTAIEWFLRQGHL
jgi:nucleoside-diphosphate-sugar epimerase